MTTPVLETRGVTRVLPGVIPVTLVRDVNLAIGQGEFVSIVGPSGSGKSSLLYLLGLLDVPSEGELYLQGRDTSTLDEHELAHLRLEKLGFVFQFHFLLPEFDALTNIMVPMRRLGKMNHRAMRERARGLLADFGLEDAADKRPGQLSGGMRQRVAVARALANDPLVILADEPTGNLDQKSGRNVFDIFEGLVDTMGTTVIAVTHDEHLSALTQRRITIVDGVIDADHKVNSGPARPGEPPRPELEI
ncbi:MAG TPA: ABC transporter ATP-binding protein [Alphaproteobacteria bacterium]|nr:ABC transporter ATP-binding protein [Alphaproteobacteria bacterium]